MSRKIITITLLFLVCLTANAAKASGKPRAMTQPDGTTVMVKLLGDENFHWYQTIDGVLLYPKSGAFYVAEVQNDGQLVPTDLLAHNLDSRTNAETEKAKAQRRHLFFAENKPKSDGMSKMAKYPYSGYCPHKGKVRIPIIMLEYPDRKFQKHGDELYAEFNEYFNSETVTPFNAKDRQYLNGFGSVKRYFLDASLGQFEPEFELYGPYTASEPHRYYAGTSPKLGREALRLAHGDIDFSQYDSDNDGNVDLVYVLYAGTGQNLSQMDDDAWPHWRMGDFGTYNGKRVNSIGVSNESVDLAFNDGTQTIRAGIGVLCHEISHGLGLPDLYWTRSDCPKDSHGLPDYNNCGPEEWDLMDGGENIYEGIWPVQYSAWERETMGWIETETLDKPSNVTINPFDDPDGRGKVYKVVNKGDNDEYYIIENFSSSRNHWNYLFWSHILELDKDIPGLIVTHVYDNIDDENILSPNNKYKKPRITLLPADNFLLAYYSIDEECWYQGKKQKITLDMYTKDEQNDPYPGPLNVTSITDYHEYSNFWGMGRNYPITDITVNSDRSISFKFMGGDPSGIAEITNESDSDTRIYTLEGQAIGNRWELLSSGIYVQNGKKIIKK